ncbi:MAG TPA: RidA family protein [Stellaceae bacterium]|nr:RidA family protein [Stellaceae bacterium]
MIRASTTAAAPPQTGKNHNPSTVWPVPDTFRGVYSHAFEVPTGKRLLFISGQVGVAPDGTLPSDFAVQCEQAMDNVEALLEAAGMARVDIVKLTYFLTRAEDAPTLGQIRRRRWASDQAPSVTALVVSALARPEYLFEIEAIAAAG